MCPGAQREREAEDELRRAEQEKAALEQAKLEALRAELLQGQQPAAEPAVESMPAPAQKQAVRALACTLSAAVLLCSSLMPSCVFVLHMLKDSFLAPFQVSSKGQA